MAITTHGGIVSFPCIPIYSPQTLMWKDELTPTSTELFHSTMGPGVAMPSVVKEIFLFFTTTVLQHIVDQSNKYALEFLEEVGRRESWTMITIEELLAYLGFMILMGIVKLPSIDDYWRRDEVFHYAPVANRISQEQIQGTPSLPSLC